MQLWWRGWKSAEGIGILPSRLDPKLLGLGTDTAALVVCNYCCIRGFESASRISYLILINRSKLLQFSTHLLYFEKRESREARMLSSRPLWTMDMVRMWPIVTMKRAGMRTRFDSLMLDEFQWCSEFRVNVMIEIRRIPQIPRYSGSSLLRSPCSSWPRLKFKITSITKNGF